MPQETEKDTVKAPKIVGLCSSFSPNHYTQEEMLQAFLKNNPCSEEDANWTRRVFEATSIEGCYSALPKEKLFAPMQREEYLQHIKHTLKSTGIESCTGAIREWGGDISQITHIIWGTMTGGMHAPSMDIEITQALGLSGYVKRLNVENMGCLTGFRCLSLASTIAKESDSNVVLVVVGDVRNALGNLSLPTENNKIDRSLVIISSLFRDACAAAIVTCADHSHPIYSIRGSESYIIPNTFHLVQYTEKNGGYVYLNISKELPERLGDCIPEVTQRLMKNANVNIDIQTEADVCLHTGGPRIIKYVQDALNLVSEQFESTWLTMKQYGNLSGSSNMVVLDQYRKLGGIDDVNESAARKKWVLGVSVGPGVCIESILFERQL